MIPGRRRTTLGLGAAVLAGLWASRAPAAPALPASGTEKPYGVLLLGDGSDEAWRKTVAEAKEKLGKKFPIEFAPGLADPREVQKAVDAFERRRVRAIVAIPLFVSSFSEVMDQNRYLLGIREKPSDPFVGSDDPRLPSSRTSRVRFKGDAPVVLTKALDDHPALVAILAARAQEVARGRLQPGSVLVLAGEGPEPEAANKDWLASSQVLADKVAKAAGFASAAVVSLREPARQTQRERSQSGLRKRLSDLRGQGPLVVVPLELSRTDALARLPRILEGIPHRYDGKPILPDARVLRFIEESAEAGSRLPDMRLFKEGKGAGAPRIAPPPSLQNQQKIDTRPTIDTRRKLGDTE